VSKHVRLLPARFPAVLVVLPGEFRQAGLTQNMSVDVPVGLPETDFRPAERAAKAALLPYAIEFHKIPPKIMEKLLDKTRSFC
jgi:hypothetical protein